MISTVGLYPTRIRCDMGLWERHAMGYGGTVCLVRLEDIILGLAAVVRCRTILQHYNLYNTSIRFDSSVSSLVLTHSVFTSISGSIRPLLNNEQPSRKP
jgi:hypothetical protein